MPQQRFIFFLEQLQEKFYNYNSSKDPERRLGLSRAIYSPEVTQFKTDDGNYDLISEENRPQYNLITIAAPNVNGYGESEEFFSEIIPDRKNLFSIMVERIKLTLLTAIENKNDTIVLGAFGCGVFEVPPEISSEAFRYVLFDLNYKQYFQNIIFNIYTAQNSPKKENFRVFNDKFSDVTKNYF